MSETKKLSDIVAEVKPPPSNPNARSVVILVDPNHDEKLVADIAKDSKRIRQAAGGNKDFVMFGTEIKTAAAYENGKPNYNLKGPGFEGKSKDSIREINNNSDVRFYDTNYDPDGIKLKPEEKRGYIIQHLRNVIANENKKETQALLGEVRKLYPTEFGKLKDNEVIEQIQGEISLKTAPGKDFQAFLNYRIATDKESTDFLAKQFAQSNSKVLIAYPGEAHALQGKFGEQLTGAIERETKAPPGSVTAQVYIMTKDGPVFSKELTERVKAAAEERKETAEFAAAAREREKLYQSAEQPQQTPSSSNSASPQTPAAAKPSTLPQPEMPRSSPSISSPIPTTPPAKMIRSGNGMKFSDAGLGENAEFLAAVKILQMDGVKENTTSDVAKEDPQKLVAQMSERGVKAGEISGDAGSTNVSQPRVEDIRTPGQSGQDLSA